MLFLGLMSSPRRRYACSIAMLQRHTWPVWLTLYCLVQATSLNMLIVVRLGVLPLHAVVVLAFTLSCLVLDPTDPLHLLLCCSAAMLAFSQVAARCSVPIAVLLCDLCTLPSLRSPSLC